MLIVRLQRAGRKNNPAFRIVVAENSWPIKWRFLEKVWSYICWRKDETLQIDLERIAYWISKWAQVSDVVARLSLKKWLPEAEKFIKKRVMKPKKPVEVKKQETVSSVDTDVKNWESVQEVKVEENTEEIKQEVVEEPKEEPKIEEIKDEKENIQESETWDKDQIEPVAEVKEEISDEVKEDKKS